MAWDVRTLNEVALCNYKLRLIWRDNWESLVKDQGVIVKVKQIYLNFEFNDAS